MTTDSLGDAASAPYRELAPEFPSRGVETETYYLPFNVDDKKTVDFTAYETTPRTARGEALKSNIGIKIGTVLWGVALAAPAISRVGGAVAGGVLGGMAGAGPLGAIIGALGGFVAGYMGGLVVGGLLGGIGIAMIKLSGGSTSKIDGGQLVINIFNPIEIYGGTISQSDSMKSTWSQKSIDKQIDNKALGDVLKMKLRLIPEELKVGGDKVNVKKIIMDCRSFISEQRRQAFADSCSGCSPEDKNKLELLLYIHLYLDQDSTAFRLSTEEEREVLAKINDLLQKIDKTYQPSSNDSQELLQHKMEIAVDNCFPSSYDPMPALDSEQ